MVASVEFRELWRQAENWGGGRPPELSSRGNLRRIGFPPVTLKFLQTASCRQFHYFGILFVSGGPTQGTPHMHTLSGVLAAAPRVWRNVAG